VLSAPGPWSHRILHSRLALAVSGGACGFSPVAVPRSLARPGSSSRRLPSSSESSRPVLVPTPLGARTPPLGLRLPLRDSGPWHRCVGIPTPPPSVLGVSHALDGLIRHRLRGFISPHSHVQGSPFRGFPSSHSRTSSSLARALSSVGSGPLPVLPPAPGSVAPPSGLCSVRRVRCLRVGVTHRDGPFPSWAYSSSRCSLSSPPKARYCFRPLLALRERPSSRPFA